MNHAFAVSPGATEETISDGGGGCRPGFSRTGSILVAGVRRRDSRGARIDA